MHLLIWVFGSFINLKIDEYIAVIDVGKGIGVPSSILAEAVTNAFEQVFLEIYESIFFPPLARKVNWAPGFGWQIV